MTLGDRRRSAGPSPPVRAAMAQHDVQLGERRVSLSVYAFGERVTVFAPEGSATVEQGRCARACRRGCGRWRPAHRADAGQGDRLPRAARRQAVKQGQALAVMEAMKMEHTITAPRDGTVEALLYAPGDQVAEGGELLRAARRRDVRLARDAAGAAAQPLRGAAPAALFGRRQLGGLRATPKPEVLRDQAASCGASLLACTGLASLPALTYCRASDTSSGLPEAWQTNSTSRASLASLSIAATLMPSPRSRLRMKWMRVAMRS